jgi:hypothetical protein
MSKSAIVTMAAFTSICVFHESLAQEGASRPYETVQSARAFKDMSFGVNLTSADVDTVDDNIFAFGAFGDFLMSPDFSLGFSLDYWNDEFNSAPTRTVEIGDLVFGGNGKFTFANFAGVRPYALAGLAAHFFRVTTTERNLNPDPTKILSGRDRNLEDAEFEMGVDFGVGLNYRMLTAVDLLGEVRYRRILDRTIDLDQMNYTVALAYSM